MPLSEPAWPRRHHRSQASSRNRRSWPRPPPAPALSPRPRPRWAWPAPPAVSRAMARASAEDLRDALPHVEVPTLLVYGDNDVRAPLTVAGHLHAAIADATLVVRSGGWSRLQRRRSGRVQYGRWESSEPGA